MVGRNHVLESARPAHRLGQPRGIEPNLVVSAWIERILRPESDASVGNAVFAFRFRAAVNEQDDTAPPALESHRTRNRDRVGELVDVSLPLRQHVDQLRPSAVRQRLRDVTERVTSADLERCTAWLERHKEPRVGEDFESMLARFRKTYDALRAVSPELVKTAKQIEAEGFQLFQAAEGLRAAWAIHNRKNLLNVLNLALRAARSSRATSATSC